MSNVGDMTGMFWGATSFNQPLEKWNLSSVLTLTFMFYEAKAFNQNLDSWNIPQYRGDRRISQAMMFESSGMSKLPIWLKIDIF